jgi:hypothetical protein
MKVGLVGAIDAAECVRQATLLQREAPGESNTEIQAALLSMAEGWLTLAKQLEWVVSMRTRSSVRRGTAESATMARTTKYVASACVLTALGAIAPVWAWFQGDLLGAAIIAVPSALVLAVGFGVSWIFLEE